MTDSEEKSGWVRDENGGANAPREIGRFSALGNRFLLERPLAQVQVSRRDFAYKREEKPRPKTGEHGTGLKIARDAAKIEEARRFHYSDYHLNAFLQIGDNFVGEI